MLKNRMTIIGVISLFTVINYSSIAQQKVNWNGYLQYRFTDDYLNETNFSIRRAKFWVDGLLPAREGDWGYKVQAIFHQQVKFQFLLQDVLINYKINDFAVTAGQFVPNFSLQRKEPDYAIPLNERAEVVNALVPGAETMARDIGVEVKLVDHETGLLSFGFFNGNGANNVSDRRNFLYVNHANLRLINHSDSKLELGYSISYRDAHGLQFSKIFGKDFSFTGNDFRFGIEGKINIGSFEFQSEYIEAHTGSRKAHGYYALCDYLLDSKNLVTLSIEKLNDLNDSTVDDPWYTLGYSYLLKGDNIKFTLNNRTQFSSRKAISYTTLQLQYFFN